MDEKRVEDSKPAIQGAELDKEGNADWSKISFF